MTLKDSPKVKRYEKSSISLKTLKDMPDNPYSVRASSSDVENGVRKFKRNIKAEAVKDVKAIQNLENNPLDKAWEKITGKKIRYSEEAKQGMINYVKWKNNLTEEDVQDDLNKQEEQKNGINRN